MLAGIDWNPAFEMTNKRIEQLAAIFREKNRGIRTTKWGEMESECHKPYEQLVSGQASAAIKNAGSARITEGAC